MTGWVLLQRIWIFSERYKERKRVQETSWTFWCPNVRMLRSMTGFSFSSSINFGSSKLRTCSSCKNVCIFHAPSTSNMISSASVLDGLAAVAEDVSGGAKGGETTAFKWAVLMIVCVCFLATFLLGGLSEALSGWSSVKRSWLFPSVSCLPCDKGTDKALFFVGGDFSSSRPTSGVDDDDDSSSLLEVLDGLTVDTLFCDLLAEERRGDTIFSFGTSTKLLLE